MASPKVNLEEVLGTRQASAEGPQAKWPLFEATAELAILVSNELRLVSTVAVNVGDAITSNFDVDKTSIPSDSLRILVGDSGTAWIHWHYLAWVKDQGLDYFS